MKAFFFLVLSFVFSYVHSQASDSCTSPLTLQTAPQFNTSSLHCVSVWVAQDFILRYGQAAPNLWSFLLSAPNTNGYVGIGFSPNGDMVESRAIVGWVGADGTNEMKKYYLGGQSPNLVRVESANQGLQINGTSMALQSNRIYMAFQLTTDSPSPTTKLIYAVGPDGRLPAGTNYQLTQHQDMITTSIDYATGQFQKEKSPNSSLRRSHGLLNMLGWAILMPIGAMVARYMRKWDPAWFYAHGIIQSIGFILGLSGVICGFVLENRLKASSVGKHKGIGITVLVLGSLQVIAILARPDKESKVRKYWNWYHFGVGRALIFLAAINVFYGIHLGNAGSGWNAGFAIFLALVFIVSLILELKMWFKK